jgi:uncharacterized ParB-like nuclease family protein
MRLEFHQLDRRHEHLRARNPQRQRQLLASLAASGQQSPIVVVAVPDQPDRFLVIDGHKRIAALEQLGRDTVEAVIWPLALLARRNVPTGTDSETLVFASRNGTPLNAKNLLRRVLQPACRELGLSVVGWHSFRHYLSFLTMSSPAVPARFSP